MPMRPASRVCMKLMNPMPSSPSRFSSGTSTSSKISSRVSEARHPSLFSFFPALKPFMSGSESSCPNVTFSGRCERSARLVRMKELMPLVPIDGSVTAVATNISPTPPCVMNTFDPLST